MFFILFKMSVLVIAILLVLIFVGLVASIITEGRFDAPIGKVVACEIIALMLTIIALFLFGLLAVIEWL